MTNRDRDSYPDDDPARTSSIVSEKIIAIEIGIMHIRGSLDPGKTSGLQRCSNSLYAYHVPSSIVHLCVNCNITTLIPFYLSPVYYSPAPWCLPAAPRFLLHPVQQRHPEKLNKPPQPPCSSHNLHKPRLYHPRQEKNNFSINSLMYSWIST